MSLSEELYELLPRLYRQRDAEPVPDGALAALLRVLGTQGDVVAADLAWLYDDWFIETCADWVVPYLGDLLGVRLLHPVGPGAGRPRAYVANTMAYRRRKGTVGVLEQLGYDVTGWPAAAVEYFQRLGVTQHANHVRLGAVRTPDLRDPDALELLGGPFGRATHTAEAREVPAGRYGIPNVGLHVWRTGSYRVVRSTARPVADPPDGHYHVDPVGLDIPLFNTPRTEEEITSLAREEHVPAVLRRRALYDELERLRAGGEGPPRWFGPNPVIEVWADTGAGLAQIPAEQLTAANLADPPAPTATGWRRPAAPVVAAVDPLLGRVAFRAGTVPTEVEVGYAYGFPSSIGAGPYDRHDDVVADLLARASWFRAVGRRLTPTAGVTATSLAAAVADWNAEPPGTVGVIAIVDSRTYDDTPLTGDDGITVPAGSELLLVSGTWPQVEDVGPGAEPATLSQLTAADQRPHLRGDIEVTGTVTGAAGDPDTPRGRIVLDGLLVEGDVRVAPGDLGELALRHVTVVPGRGMVAVLPPDSAATDNGGLSIDIEGSVLGPVALPAEGPTLRVQASVVDGVGDGGGASAVDAAHAGVTLEAVSVLGTASARTLAASDCLFLGAVTVARRQQGCVRFCFVPEGSLTPRRYRCQPDLALAELAGASGGGESEDAVRARLTPVFTSTRYGDPGYAQLDDRCAAAIRTGASTGAEPGAFADLLQPQREDNLRAALGEYLRLGLAAGVFHET